jgi:hypothetical protein
MPALAIGDRVQMKKPHPCGATDWTVERVGAHVALRCLGCGRRVMLTRAELHKRMKRIVAPARAEGTGDP